MRMLVAKDRYSIAVMKSLGYRDRDIKAQYLARALVVLTIGVIAGTLLANTVGEMAAGALIASFGASSFSFEIDPIRVYGFLPALLAAVVLAATMLGSSDAGAITLSQSIKES
jgi:putative ABC transport system permease protein